MNLFIVPKFTTAISTFQPSSNKVVLEQYSKLFNATMNLTSTRLNNYQQTRTKCQSGRYKFSRTKNRFLTYEMCFGPNYIGVRKGWNSWNTSSLVGTEHTTADVTLDDIFIRSFIEGTWPKLFLSEIIIKRRANMVIITGIVGYLLSPMKYYWLIGYTEEILARIIKCPVKMDIQTTPDKNSLIYKTLEPKS